MQVYAPARTVVVYAPAHYLESPSDPLDALCAADPRHAARPPAVLLRPAVLGAPQSRARRVGRAQCRAHAERMGALLKAAGWAMRMRRLGMGAGRLPVGWKKA